jgi:hypothetical protein
MLGVSPSTPEKLQLAELPQFFADMQGWEELAQGRVEGLPVDPAEERTTTVALVSTTVKPARSSCYARKYPLPRVICAHNSYWFWGVGTPASPPSSGWAESRTITARTTAT